MRNTKKLLTIFSITAFLIFLFLFSEAIYVFNRRPDQIAAIFLALAKNNSANVNLDRVSDYLYQYSIFTIKSEKKHYFDKLPDKPLYCSFAEVDEQTKNAISDYSKDYLDTVKISDSSVLISNWNYKVGLMLYEAGKKDDAKCFFKNAIYLNPELSYLYIELANAYFWDGDTEKAMPILEYCTAFDMASGHCKIYAINNTTPDGYEPVGKHKNTIDLHQGVEKLKNR